MSDAVMSNRSGNATVSLGTPSLSGHERGGRRQCHDRPADRLRRSPTLRDAGAGLVAQTAALADQSLDLRQRDQHDEREQRDAEDL
jgi:hypothetical protein